ncbi:unnamed protein product [Amoebophrya sp. A25]|nr:unnamed protein product [Amoebophrya sp. A25]|eukprot:GSA25T00014281001.1
MNACPNFRSSRLNPQSKFTLRVFAVLSPRVLGFKILSQISIQNQTSKLNL